MSNFVTNGPTLLNSINESVDEVVLNGEAEKPFKYYISRTAVNSATDAFKQLGVDHMRPGPGDLQISMKYDIYLGTVDNRTTYSTRDCDFEELNCALKQKHTHEKRIRLHFCHQDFNILTKDPNDAMPIDEFGKLLDGIISMACPREGGFVGWKAVVVCGDFFGAARRMAIAAAILKLYIPASARRSSAFTTKCRASRAIVLEGYVLEQDGSIVPWNSWLSSVKPFIGTKYENPVLRSRYDSSYRYRIGYEAQPWGEFENCRFIECASGIHFFVKVRDVFEFLACRMVSDRIVTAYFHSMWDQHVKKMVADGYLDEQILSGDTGYTSSHNREWVALHPSHDLGDYTAFSAMLDWLAAKVEQCDNDNVDAKQRLEEAMKNNGTCILL